MIKTESQRKARTMDGKPIGEFFNEAAQRQKRDNRFASYDAPGRGPLPAADKETKAEQKTETPVSEKMEAKAKAGPSIAESFAGARTSALRGRRKVSGAAKGASSPAADKETKAEQKTETPVSEKMEAKPKASARLTHSLSKARAPGIASMQAAAKTSTMSKPTGNASVHASPKGYGDAERLAEQIRPGVLAERYKQASTTTPEPVRKGPSVANRASKRLATVQRHEGPIAAHKAADDAKTKMEALHSTPALDAAKSIGSGIAAKYRKASGWFRRHYIDNNNPPARTADIANR